MKTHGFLLICVLLLARAAQAVNTEAPLNEQSQRDLIGHVELALPVKSLDGSGPAEGVLQPVLEVHPDFPPALVTDPAASLAQGGSLLDDLSGAADQPAERHWSTDPKRYTDAGFVSANSRVDLPSFAEMDWMATPLPTAKKASLMEILVFPALGALMVVAVLAMVIVRLRKRRSVRRARLLLHIWP